MTQPSNERPRKVTPLHNGFLRWEYDPGDGNRSKVFGPQTASTPLHPWESGPGRFRRQAGRFATMLFRNVLKLAALLLVFTLGASLATGPDSLVANIDLREKLRRTEAQLQARQGELALARQEMQRLSNVVDHSSRYGIPADLAASIYDIAKAEGIDPKIAFGLVNVESEFYHKAISPKGAVGLTQVMPSTARLLEPSLTHADLFDRETNLRLGFRYLREMINYYKGDLNLALTAYNRGPGTVDQVRRIGGDPNNGYAGNVLRGTN